MAATDGHNPDYQSLTVAGGWCAPPPLYQARIPGVGENWRGVEHGSLFHILAVDEAEEDGRPGVQTWVTYLVMYQGNPHWHERYPPGSVRRVPLEGFLTLLEYAPEWNHQ